MPEVASRWRNRIVDHGTEAPDQILAHPFNWRIHPKAQQDALSAQLDAVGWVQDVIVNRRTGHLIDGHLRVSLAISREELEIPVVYVDLDPDEEALVLASLDPLAGMAVTDSEQLSELLSEIEIPAGELADLLAETAGTGAKAGNTDADDVPDVVEEPYVKRGDLYALGDHRLLCGDATDAGDAERLLGGERLAAVVTDPPYAIYGSSTGLSSSITDDKIVRPFFRDVLRLAEGAVKLFGHVYIFCDWRSWPSWWEMAKGGHLEPKNLLVWSKNGSGLGSNYANTYELIGFFALMPEQRTMTGAKTAGQRAVLKPNILYANRPTGDDRQHNAAKPVGLIEDLITNSTDEAGGVLDPFLGSGTTMIAAERLGRRCYGMEIEPRYVQVAIERWEAYTGQKAEQVDG